MSPAYLLLPCHGGGPPLSHSSQQIGTQSAPTLLSCSPTSQMARRSFALRNQNYRGLSGGSGSRIQPQLSKSLHLRPILNRLQTPYLPETSGHILGAPREVPGRLRGGDAMEHIIANL